MLKSLLNEVRGLFRCSRVKKKKFVGIIFIDVFGFIKFACKLIKFLRKSNFYRLIMRDNVITNARCNVK